MAGGGRVGGEKGWLVSQAERGWEQPWWPLLGCIILWTLNRILLTFPPTESSQGLSPPPNPYFLKSHHSECCMCIFLFLSVAQRPGRVPGIQWVFQKCPVKD